jgi:hypothetical protein
MFRLRIGTLNECMNGACIQMADMLKKSRVLAAPEHIATSRKQIPAHTYTDIHSWVSIKIAALQKYLHDNAYSTIQLSQHRPHILTLTLPAESFFLDACHTNE